MPIVFIITKILSTLLATSHNLTVLSSLAVTNTSLSGWQARPQISPSPWPRRMVWNQSHVSKVLKNERGSKIIKGWELGNTLIKLSSTIIRVRSNERIEVICHWKESKLPRLVKGCLDSNTVETQSRREKNRNKWNFLPETTQSFQWFQLFHCL